MKQTDSINRNKHEIAIIIKQTDSINRNKHEIDKFN